MMSADYRPRLYVTDMGSTIDLNHVVSVEAVDSDGGSSGSTVWYYVVRMTVENSTQCCSRYTSAAAAEASRMLLLVAWAGTPEEESP